MSDYLYSRISTDEQTTAAQLTNLIAKYPNARIVSEVASGAKSRPMLTKLVSELQEGDRLIVAALDRLGRRTAEILNLIEDLQARGVTLISEREGVNYATPVGRLVTQILVSIAEMERSLIIDRTKAGLKAARAKGRVGGRPKVYNDAKVSEALDKIESGSTLREVEKMTGISRSQLSWLRRKKAAKAM